MNYLCDVVVLAWNQVDMTKNFVESFLTNTLIPSRLIMIDNASTDETKDYLLSLKDTAGHKFKIIINEENRGFVGGMNQGIEESSAPYVCLANNDLTFTKGWLKKIIYLFEKNKNIGVLNPNSNNLGAKPKKGTSLDDFAVDLENKYNNIFIEMPFCIGFCMVIKKEVIDKVGGLSTEFYPMLFEDTDFSMKVSKAGYHIGMAKASYVWHKEHASLDKIGKRKEELFARNRDIFLKKWGKTLRIAWIVSNYRDLSKSLDQCVSIARSGNFVWIFSKNLRKNKTSIFQEKNLCEHTGVNLINFCNILHLSWNILKKKKKYDIIITTDRIIEWLFRRFGYKILNSLDKDKIEAIKRSA